MHLTHSDAGGDLGLGEPVDKTHLEDDLFAFGELGEGRGQHRPVVDARVLRVHAAESVGHRLILMVGHVDGRRAVP